MWPNPQFPADLVTLTEEILNGKLHFLCSEMWILTLLQKVSSQCPEQFSPCDKVHLHIFEHLINRQLLLAPYKLAFEPLP